MRERIDFEGQRFGRLIVGSHNRTIKSKTQTVNYWNCTCDCGNQTVVRVGNFRNGSTKSCGCLMRETTANKNRTHSMSYTREYQMYKAATKRAKQSGSEFNLDLSDVIIPDLCPYLGIELDRHNNKIMDNSPALDRIDNSKGYIKGNVEVISYKANRIKNDSTHSELLAIGNRLERLMDEDQEFACY